MQRLSREWNESDWKALDQRLTRAALAAPTNDAAWNEVAREARDVLRRYSTSFFMVTRFLPPLKRTRVEAIYAAVRYPDEVVDTFPLTAQERHDRLDRWEHSYERALSRGGLRASVADGVPPFVAAFVDVLRQSHIPTEHYRAFLKAMREDITPRRYRDLDDLIENYVYGSAVVVGYFLTYVYGAQSPHEFNRALKSARDLGIALQLTNFLRDVREDWARGRFYLPLDQFAGEGIASPDINAPEHREALVRVLRRMAALTQSYYNRATDNLDAFAVDSQPAIRACIEVYRQLNARVASDDRDPLRRESVPLRRKLSALPPSKYWRLPLSYLRR